MMNLRKLKKAIFNPGYFFRDFFIKRYPLLQNQNNVKFLSEEILLENEKVLLGSFDPGFAIDLVYTWVNSNDTNWLESKNLHIQSADSNIENFSTDESRFENHNEIFYSLLGVAKYMPWVRNIFIISDNQLPKIPESLVSKIKVIDHKQIIPLRFLPTYNSHVIEAYLHKIPGLSENFIYFNDDFFVSRPVKPSHFYRSNGLCSIFVSAKSLEDMNRKGVSTATLTASNNCNKLLMENFNISFDTPLTHTYVPLKKSAYNLAFDVFEKQIEEFSGNKFRGDNDLNMATFLVPYLQYIKGVATPHLDISYYFNIRSPNAKSLYKNLMAVKNTSNAPHSFCANDFNAVNFKQNTNYKLELQDFLKKYFTY
ncbi:stealth family protein [Rahnella aceris]|uniref:stealth family protein n=1 Tax=Rahnella sp. (strain Y9602) TaxID=2703885 RepID=UPI000F1D26AF|nr:Stealth-like protein [Rahnella aquatilis]